MPDKKLDEVYIFHLEKAYKQFRKYKTHFLKNEGIDITSDQWILLKRIKEKEGINQKELATSTFKEPASVTRILDILEKKKWVERRPVKNDRRAYELYTTLSGKTLIKKILPLAIKIRALGTKGFSKKEVDTLNQMLIRLFENFS